MNNLNYKNNPEEIQNKISTFNAVRQDGFQENNQKLYRSQQLPENEKSPEEYKTRTKLTLRERIELIRRNVTVEPVLACYFVASVLSLLCSQNFYLDRACRVNLNYTSEICDALVARSTENYTQEEISVQQLVSSVLTWKSAIQTAIPCGIILFAGAWSDKYGRRKIFIILPILGELVAYSSFTATMYRFELGIESMALVDAVPQALSGGWFLMLLGIFSYIGDVTSDSERTFRIGVVNVFMSLAVPFGTSLSGFLLHTLGYYGAYLVSISLYTISIFYGILILKDVRRSREEVIRCTRWELVSSFFDLNSLKGPWNIAFNDGPLKRRIKIGLIIFTAIIVFGQTQGDLSVQYQYTRYKFKWDEVNYSLFSTYRMTMLFIGTTIAMGLFSARWHLRDATIGMIASVSTILSSFVYVFAATTAVVYLAPLLEIFNGASYIAVRSIASKVVSRDEQGKMNSLIGLAESVTPALFSPLYLYVYGATLPTFPGAVFLVGTALAAVAAIIFIYFGSGGPDLHEYSEGDEANNQEEEVKKKVNQVKAIMDTQL